MDLQKALNNILAELDARSAALDQREADLTSEEQQNQETVTALQAQQAVLADYESQLETREQNVSNVENDETRKANLIQLQNQTSQKMSDLKQYESSLADIKAALDQREQQVAVREQAVSDREISYREELKKAFFEQVAKGLPQ